MARISGVDIPNGKRVEIGLTYVYGIGLNKSRRILESSKIDPSIRVKDLTDAQLGLIKNFIETNYVVEGDLRKEVHLNIKRLRDIRCYKGIRHSKGLPVNGQRTKTNARTRKGPVRAAIKGKQKVKK